MNFSQCLSSAVEQGALNRAEAEDLLRRFEELRGQHGLNFDAATAGKMARDDLAAELRFDAIETRRRAKLQKAAIETIERDLSQFRDAKGRGDVVTAALKKLEHFGYAGYSSVEGRAKTIIGMAHAEINDMLATFERDVLAGRRKEMPRLESVLKEMHGEATGDATARAFAGKMQSVFEALRQRFNAAGGAIGKLDGYALPQWHDAEALLRTGREPWKAAIKPLLDLDKMRDPVTGGPFNPAKLDHTLNVIFDRITTDGWIDRVPKAQVSGEGMLASQRAEHRFLHFKGSEAWQKYADAFGQGDPFTVMMSHIRGMAHDIAAMEVLGPNPAASLEYMKQLIKTEKAKAIAGQPSAFNAKNPLSAFSKGDGSYALDSLWSIVRGGEVVNAKMGTAFGDVRNLLTSAQLGSAILGALPTDPFLAQYAKKLTGIPAKNIISEFLGTFRGASRQEAVAAGLILEDALFVMGREARYAGALAGGNGTRWLADRTIHLSGLAAWTQARKHVFGMEFQKHAAAELAAGKTWEGLDVHFREAMAGYGLTATDWATMAKAKRHALADGVSVLRPAELAALDRGVAERYLEAILGMTERAVPSGTKLGRALVTGGQKAGTVPGELLNGIMQYKAFGLSVAMLQKEALSREIGMTGKAGGAKYAGGLLFSLTMGGAMAIQLRALANGKDPQPMDDARFWLAAAKAGGGFGIYGDFLFAEHGRFGHSVLEDLAGPQIGLAADAISLVGGAARGALGDEDTGSAADKALRFGRRYVPVVSSLLYTRAAWNRMALDQLQYLIDPEAHQSFRRQERKLDREFNQGYYWRPGEMLPGRVPDFTPDRMFAP